MRLKNFRKRPSQEEAREQTFLNNWIENNAPKQLKPLFFAIPNGEKRPTKTYINKRGEEITYCPAGKRLKDQGVKKGVLDYFIMIPKTPYYGLMIEMKSKEGKLSPEQAVFIDAARKVGYRCEVARSFSEAKNYILDYFGVDRISNLSINPFQVRYEF